ncbi:hypothetical protein EMUCRT_0099 [Ehrlichia cf. muris str. EmCRT]|uniref:Uncharacterized protein n=1 Tax=Ehrlichia cf. muris str. EmCRT TaxID=1359167 RepID=A0A0F3NDX3_9RICK|nr:hypothetical protein EMUCRT_0099 [Ehrlichia cf. muris str. EmCRT]
MDNIYLINKKYFHSGIWKFSIGLYYVYKAFLRSYILFIV